MEDPPDAPVLSPAALRVLREDQPSEREFHAAYQRFARKPQRRARALLVSRWLIAGLAMGLGIAFGAEAVVQQLQPAPSVQLSPVGAPPGAIAKNVPLSARLPSPKDALAASAEPPPASSELRPPRAAGAGNWRAASVSAEERPAADSAVWAKAAQGLRNNDIVETEAALATLEHVGSTSDREAARLIRAQLMLHQGDSNGARALLQDLAGNAQSAQVRAKAQSLLSQSATKSNSALNNAPSGT